MKKLTILISTVLLMALLLCACGGAKDSIVGTWSVTEEDTTLTITFKEDNTGTVSALGGVLSVNCTYEAKDGKLSITPDESSSDLFDFNLSVGDYTIDGDKLTLTENGVSFTLTKQK